MEELIRLGALHAQLLSPCPVPSLTLPCLGVTFSQDKVKCCGLVEKSREAPGTEKDLLEMSPSCPL